MNRTVIGMGFACIVLASSAAVCQVNHVIHISVDGLRGDFIESRIQAEPEEYANFHRFVTEGATTFNARTDYTHTNTLPNHTAMLTARPVLQPEGGPETAHHGYVQNSVPRKGATLHTKGNKNVSYIPSTFDVAHDAGLSTALFASKPKFVLYDRSYNRKNGAPDVMGRNNGKDKIDYYYFNDNTSELMKRLTAKMKKNPYNYTFVHFLNPDIAGHNNDWGSKSWDASVRKVDEMLGQIFELANSSSELAGHTAIILTADHGGHGDGHSPSKDVRNYTIPVFVWGPGVAKGADLYELNSQTHADPGAERPDFNAPQQPIRNGSTGNLALKLLGLQPIAGTDRYFKSVNVN